MIYLYALFTIDKTKKVLQLNIEVPYPKNSFFSGYFSRKQLNFYLCLFYIYYKATIVFIFQHQISISQPIDYQTHYNSSNSVYD